MPRVLLADDSPHAQRMGAEILTQGGFEVLSITDGGEVLESLERFSPDLVLADAGMPTRSGYEICERIKTNPALGHVKVVLLVGAMEPLNAAEAKRVGADAVLHKPFEPSVVIETIGPLLAPSPAAPPAPTTSHGEFESAVQQVLRDLHPGAPVDRERVRAAVVLAVESALPAFLDELTERVVEALRQTRR